jgi:hypothetical protein
MATIRWSLKLKMSPMQAVDMLNTLLVAREAMNDRRVVTTLTLRGPASADAGWLTHIALEIKTKQLWDCSVAVESLMRFTCKRVNSEI